MTKRKQHSVLLVYAYIHQEGSITKYNIPKEIIDLIHLFFYICIDPWLKCGNLLTIDDDTVTKSMEDGTAWQSAIGSVVAKSGIHEWKIKIIKYSTNLSSNQLMIDSFFVFVDTAFG